MGITASCLRARRINPSSAIADEALRLAELDGVASERTGISVDYKMEWTILIMKAMAVEHPHHSHR